MTIILVPDWDNMSEDVESTSDLNGFRVAPDTRYGTEVVMLKNRYETLPAKLREFPYKVIALVKHNSPVTQAEDGRYVEGNFRARVESYVDDGVTQQHIRVEGYGESLESVNDWFDCLILGEKKFFSARFLRESEVRAAMDR